MVWIFQQSPCWNFPWTKFSTFSHIVQSMFKYRHSQCNVHHRRGAFGTQRKYVVQRYDFFHPSPCLNFPWTKMRMFFPTFRSMLKCCNGQSPWLYYDCTMTVLLLYDYCTSIGYCTCTVLLLYYDCTITVRSLDLRGGRSRSRIRSRSRSRSIIYLADASCRRPLGPRPVQSWVMAVVTSTSNDDDHD